MSRHDWRLVPLAVAAWIGCWAGTSGWRPATGLLCAGIGVLVVCALLLRKIWFDLAVCVLVVAAVLAGVRSSAVHEGLPARWAAEEPLGSALIRLEGEPALTQHSGRTLAIARATLLELEVNRRSLSTSQPVLLLAGDQLATELMDIAPGAVYRILGRLGSSEPESHEALVVRVTRISGETRAPDFFNALVTAIHAGLREAASHSPPEQAALVPSLVVGDRSGITPELTDVFRATSLSHLLAVSGSNLTLLLGVLLFATRFIGVRGWAVRGVAAGGVALFVLVCRAEPSVLRAAAMGLVALPAMGIGRGKSSVRNLSVAILVLLPLDPWLSRSWGFALSAAACLGISVGAGPMVKSMGSWAPGWLAEAIAGHTPADNGAFGPSVGGWGGRECAGGSFRRACHCAGSRGYHLDLGATGCCPGGLAGGLGGATHPLDSSLWRCDAGFSPRMAHDTSRDHRQCSAGWGCCGAGLGSTPAAGRSLVPDPWPAGRRMATSGSSGLAGEMAGCVL